MDKPYDTMGGRLIPGNVSKEETAPPRDTPLTITRDMMLALEIQEIMSRFRSGHLPDDLKRISVKIAQVASDMNGTVPDCFDKVEGLRKLLEAKDCFVRAGVSSLVDDPTT
jgi:hypothetical protein